MTATATIDMLHDLVEYRLSRHEVESVLNLNEGNTARAIDELLSMLKIQELERKSSIDERAEVAASDAQLQWDLFTTEMSAHGLDESTCSDLLQLLKESRGADQLASSTIVRELLNAMDDVEEEEHPVLQLQAQFPHVRGDIVQEVFEQHDYDLVAATKALEETGHLLNSDGAVETYSYVSIAKGPAVKQSGTPGPKAFPQLQQPKAGRRAGRRVLHWAKSPNSENAWHSKNQALPTGTPATLSTKLKLEYLEKRMPSIDSDVLCTALLLNDGNMETTEAILASIFPGATPTTSNQEELERSPRFHPPRHRPPTDEPNDFAYYQERTLELMEKLQQTHCAAVRSFASGRLNHHLGRDKMQRVSQLRRELQAARENAAAAFFEENKRCIVNNGTVDLHGLFLQEALHVLEYCLEHARRKGVRKFTIVTGIGNHATKPGKMYKSVDASLAQRGIKYTRGSGNFLIQLFHT
ncbi:hypothetical protein ACHHYP_12283 [Achlya hypogyna]|uniref:Smr domain-containing protein n=1 Tax=Achlya hypogyna TaxID=1202772 RepID=A0A1V9YH76_ACHHY|nr:hypothetical protein ACHHYP_12283 [Achlya hypogyna]